MSDHLPECPWADRGFAFPCICDRLRACEKRVADDIWGAIREGSQYKSGFEGGLDAAREAVAALRSEARAYLDAGGNPRHNAATRQAIHNWTQALDAIDALRTTNP